MIVFALAEADMAYSHLISQSRVLLALFNSKTVCGHNCNQQLAERITGRRMPQRDGSTILERQQGAIARKLYMPALIKASKVSKLITTLGNLP
jgi:hypothetical protein